MRVSSIHSTDAVCGFCMAAVYYNSRHRVITLLFHGGEYDWSVL